MKVLAANERDRPQDIGDIQSLLSVAKKGEQKRAVELLGLIERRGTNRGKALVKEFEIYRKRFASRMVEP